MHRRTMLLGMAAGTVTGGLHMTRAYGTPEDIGATAPIGFPEGRRVPTVDEILAAMPRFQGERPAYEDEVKKSKVILGNCVSGPPFEVAQYFESLHNGEFNTDLGHDAHLYAEEWPIRANPVIVSFFDATTLRQPAGDQTPWCAAFVNWCMKRSVGSKSPALGTSSAASASFRNWGTATQKPEPGDLVVFEQIGNTNKGHVGFFVSMTSAGVYVLGGNQMPLRRKRDGSNAMMNSGEVNTKLLPLQGRVLKLHSFRTNSASR